MRACTTRRIAQDLALFAGVTILGLVALLGIDWEAAELDSPITEIGDMTFTPVVAGATTLLGVLLLAAAASRNGEGRVALGAITGCLGAAIVLADLEPRWHVTDSVPSSCTMTRLSVSTPSKSRISAEGRVGNTIRASS